MKSFNNVLVTGGFGFIGSHLVRHLIRMGYSVVVLDNLSAGKTEKLCDRLEKDGLHFEKGDVRDRQNVRDALCDMLLCTWQR